MTLTSYETFRKNITNRIHEIGWSLKKSEIITRALIHKVRRIGGFSWIKKHNTLTDFLTVLGNSSFGISNIKLQKFLKTFQTVNCIEALTGFIEKYSFEEISRRKKQWLALRTKVSNSPAVLKANLLREWNRLQTLETMTLQTLRTRLLETVTIGRILHSFLIMAGSFVADNEVVIGGIPLGGLGIDSPVSVQEVEVAHSNKIIKFRAVGSIFLARQVGGKDSVTITGKLVGPLRLHWLTALWYLTLLSQGKMRTITDPNVVESLRSGSGSLIRLNKIPLSKKTSIITQEPAYEKHMTFPVITTHEIIPSCYIETFSFEEKLMNDRNVITYDLLLRTYEEPGEFIIDEADDSLIRQAKGITKSQQMLKWSLNFTYRMLKWARESYSVETNIWKTENYYNVDPLDMTTVFLLSLVGGIV